MNFRYLSVLSMCLASSPLMAEELTDEKKAVIDTILTLTNAQKSAYEGIDQMSGQLTQMLKAVPQLKKPGLAEKVSDKFVLFAKSRMKKDRMLNEISYPIYHKYFTLEELKALRGFYQTPLGKKLGSANPAIVQESSVAAKAYFAGLQPEMQVIVTQVLQSEAE
ncbi:DUF2059 domain-containing protein [Sneathiella aquimaris]|uniref:DUF2059 domain-containing protein n=1 Tax=Sneathiella aquimaris TaxID=2599305 RepID=UPI00146ACC9F|nr:DUF2059 domain-containing protein [Sneathiella aquimaris]